MYNLCLDCDQECELVNEDNYDWEEFWGAPVKRHYVDTVTECCGSEDFEEYDTSEELEEAQRV